jgi:hypothetical protein
MEQRDREAAVAAGPSGRVRPHPPFDGQLHRGEAHRSCLRTLPRSEPAAHLRPGNGGDERENQEKPAKFRL